MTPFFGKFLSKNVSKFVFLPENLTKFEFLIENFAKFLQFLPFCYFLTSHWMTTFLAKFVLFSRFDPLFLTIFFLLLTEWPPFSDSWSLTERPLLWNRWPHIPVTSKYECIRGYASLCALDFSRIWEKLKLHSVFCFVFFFLFFTSELSMRKKYTSSPRYWYTSIGQY